MNNSSIIFGSNSEHSSTPSTVKNPTNTALDSDKKHSSSPSTIKSPKIALDGNDGKSKHSSTPSELKNINNALGGDNKDPSTLRNMTDTKTAFQQNHPTPSTASFYRFNDLPSELRAMIVREAVTDSNGIVDPLCPTELYNHCASRHPHGKLPLDPNLPEATGMAYYRSVQRHGLSGEKQLHAIDAIQAAKGNLTPFKPGGITPAILRVNRECYEFGIDALHNNMLIFTNIDALICFVEHYPHALEWITRVTLVASLRQRDGHFDRIMKVTPVGPWFSTCTLIPSYAVMHNTTMKMGDYFSYLRELTIHFRKWQQTEVVDTLRYVLPHQRLASAFESRHSEPVRFVRGFNGLAWMSRMGDFGWLAPKPKITGLEDMEDQKVVARMNTRIKCDQWVDRKQV